MLLGTKLSFHSLSVRFALNSSRKLRSFAKQNGNRKRNLQASPTSNYENEMSISNFSDLDLTSKLLNGLFHKG